MSRPTTPDEEATRKEMTRLYKTQEHAPDDYNDWGQFTAHVVHSQRLEIVRLRTLLQSRGIDAGDWDDPFA